MRKVILIMVLVIVSNSAKAEFACEQIKDKTTRTSCIKDRIEKEKTAATSKQEKVSSRAIEKPEFKEIIIAREAVKGTLKDPDSAKFQNERISGLLVCGEVNAKNSYGGYTGYKRYIVQDGSANFDGEEHPLFSKWWADNCVENVAAVEKKAGAEEYLAKKKAETDESIESRWKSTIEVSENEFDKNITLASAKETFGNYWGTPEKTWYLASLVNKSSGDRQYYLYFSNSYDGNWRFWKYADTDDADTLKVLEINREVGSCVGSTGCGHYETVAVVLDEKILEKAASKGLKVRISGKNADPFVITLAEDKAKDQLQAARYHSDKIKNRSHSRSGIHDNSDLPMDAVHKAEGKTISRLGIVVSELNKNRQQELQISGGLLVEDINGARARAAGLQQGDELLAIGLMQGYAKINNYTSISSLNQLNEILKQVPNGGGIVLVVQRGDTKLYVAFASF